MLQATDFRETRHAAREIKFLADTTRAARILEWARTHLTPDAHAGGPDGDEYRVTTVYFDTPGLDVLRRTGSYARSKYRVRRYGSEDVVFLERKLRTSALLSKRRTVVAIDALPRVATATIDEPGGWFARRVAVRHLLPVCAIAYRRRALVGQGDYGPMRLTIDDGLRADLRTAADFGRAPGTPALEGQVIVEVKYCVDAPALFRRLVQDFALTPSPVSKYRLGMSVLESPAAAGAGATVIGIRLAHRLAGDPAGA